LNFSAAKPFGVFGATTWLNLMTMGSAADAGVIKARAATDAAANKILRIFPPELLFWND
jgi:hypothetical protein